MAANYTASTKTIFLNVVGSYFWRLNSLLIQKKSHNIKKLNFHVTCSYEECKNYDYLKQHINYAEIIQQYHVFIGLIYLRIT